jgi:cellulose synthase/poly-beta-1,6-N-acetylglucosamine synthase-like glycosyltransferase
VAALALTASAGHVLYPAWLAWRTRGGRGKVVSDHSHERERSWPDITVVVPAYREAGVITSKIEDLRTNGYQGRVSVVVVVDGDPETAAAAESCGVRVLSGPERLGKSQALNRGFEEADTQIVVISDANNRLTPGALSALVEHFDDPEVAAVAGEKIDNSRGEGLYWKFESWLKQREDQLGTTIGLVGELAAIRADAWRPIPPDVATDDIWTALDIIERGHRVAYEPTARALEPSMTSLAAQWERRTRMISGTLHIMVRRRHQLRPSAGLVAAELWGHRLVRYTLSPVCHMALLMLATAKVRSSVLARTFLLAHLFAGAGLIVEGRTGTPSDETADAPSRHLVMTVVAASGQVVFLQAVAMGGLVRYLRGDRQTKWSTLAR